MGEVRWPGGWAVSAPVRLQGKSVSSCAVGSVTGVYLILLSGWLLDTALHQAWLMWLQLSPLNKSLKVQSAAKAVARP